MTDNNALAQELEANRPDDFNGDNAHLIACIDALLDLDDAKALVPNGLGKGSHAYRLLSAARHRIPINNPAPAPVGGDVVDLAGHTADAVRDQCRLVLGRIVSFDDSQKIADGIVAHIKGIAALQAQPAPAQGDDVVELDWATAFEKAAAKTARLEQELNIANADHIALWLEANTIPDEPMSQCISWLACRIVEAHERALAAMPPKVEAPAADEVRELAHKLRGVAAPVAAADITSSSWVYEIQYGPEGESNYAHVFASDGRLIAVMKVSDAAKIAAIRAGGHP